MVKACTFRGPDETLTDLIWTTLPVTVCIELLIRGIRASPISNAYTGGPPQCPVSLSPGVKLKPDASVKEIQNRTGLDSSKAIEVHQHLREYKEYKADKLKFDEIVAKCLIRGFHTFWGIFAVLQTPCYANGEEGDNFRRCYDNNLSPSQLWIVHKYYNLMLGWYFYRALHQFFDGHVRQDFWIMFTHHWTTIALLSGSFLGGYMQIGTVVGAVHDISDFNIALAKIFSYLKWKPLDTIVAGMFLVGWIGIRCIIFPYQVIWKRIIFAEGCHACLTEEYTNPPRPWHKDCYIFGGLCTILWLLHVYWCKFIIPYVRKAARGSGGDPRSDKEA